MRFKNNDSEKQGSVERFWHNYLLILDNNHIPAKSKQWYRKHIEHYIDSHPQAKLHQHSPENIDRYLNAKDRTAGLPEWQFRQIADALRLLFRDFLQLQWADNYDWNHWRAFAKELEPDHPTL